MERADSTAKTREVASGRTRVIGGNYKMAFGKSKAKNRGEKPDVVTIF